MTKYIYLTLCLVAICISSCQPPEKNYVKISGPAMGTRYHITMATNDAKQIQQEIDTLLDNYNLSLSTYVPTSRISKFNDSPDSLIIDLALDSTFLPVLELSEEIYQLTDGAFDPTVMPLLEFYGFGNIPQTKNDINLEKLDSIKKLVGFSMIDWYVQENRLIVKKAKPGIQLNFNSIAKGYGVDLVANLLDRKGVKDYLVEIGGEVHVQGKSPRKKDWVLGINTPDPDASLNDYQVPVTLHNEALATSGNYRNFYEVDGKKFVHIVDPISGENKESDIASATILAKDCATADALATAVIVMGKEKATIFLNNQKKISACLIVYDQDDYKTIFTENFKK